MFWEASREAETEEISIEFNSLDESEPRQNLYT